MKVLKIRTTNNNQFINIQDNIAELISQNGWRDGILIVYTPHTTAGITVNENADPDVVCDMIAAFSKMIPEINFKHGEGNSDAHIKSTIFGNQKTFIVEEGKLVLGIWQGIYFCEFDGPRNREVFLKFMGK